jgi:hypothetical protein
MSTVADGGRLTELVEAMAEAARWAPSVHNTQPWSFRRTPGGLEVHEVPERGLPVLDPSGRLRAISCGAAVLNAVVAGAAHGRHPRVRLLPDVADPSLLAVVEVGAEHDYGPQAGSDAAAVPVRRTHRRVHSPEAVTPQVLERLSQAVRQEGARLELLDRAARHRLAGLLARAVALQASTPGFVEEVERWVRHWGPGEEPVDGIPVGSLGTAPYPVDSLVQEQTDVAVDVDELREALDASTVVAITTMGDRPRDWLVAGMALQRLLLRATTAGLVATLADQATQLPQLRGELTETLDVLGHPQLVLRLGRPLVDVPVTPRRPLPDVLT